MTAHSDVMRSDRLKQVMQEIDPAFNEKDLGFSRFSKFVVEAAHKGLIALTKLDNGQYEIGLGPGVPGAAAQPAGMVAFDRPRERERGEGRGRGRRGRGGRDEREGREEHAVADAPPALPPAREERRSAFSLDGAFGLIKQAIGRLGGESRPVSAQELGAAMAEIQGDEQPVEPAQVQKLLRQAHDRELIDLAKEDDGAYIVKVRDATSSPEARQAEPAAVTDADETLDPPMPESSAPPSMRPANVPTWASGRSGENGESGESGVVGVAGVVADAAAGAAARARRAGRSAGIASVETASSPERSRSRARHGLSPHSLPHLSPLPRHVSLTSMTGAAVSRSGRR